MHRHYSPKIDEEWLPIPMMKERVDGAALARKNDRIMFNFGSINLQDRNQ